MIWSQPSILTILTCLQEHMQMLRTQLVNLQISEYTLNDAVHEMWSYENADTQLESGLKTLDLRTLRQIIVDIGML